MDEAIQTQGQTVSEVIEMINLVILASGEASFLSNRGRKREILIAVRSVLLKGRYFGKFDYQSMSFAHCRVVAPDFRNGEPQPYPHIAGSDTGGYLRYTKVLPLFVTAYS